MPKKAKLNSRISDYDFHGILKMRILVDQPSFLDGYLNQTFSHYRVDQVDNPELLIQVGDFVPSAKKRFLVDGRYHIAEDQVFYQNKYKFARWAVEIEGLTSDCTRVRIKGNLASRIVFPGETIYSLIRYKLALKGHPLIHGSALGRNAEGYIFSARGGTGKTITAINLVKNGFDYYSDDSVILGPGELCSFIVPFNLRFTYDVEKLLGIHFSPLIRAELFMKKILYYLSLKQISLFTTLDAKDVFKDSIRERTKLAKVFVLTHGPEFSIDNSCSREEIAKKLFLNLWFESPELIAMLYAYNFIFPDNPLAGFWDEVYAAIVRNIASAKLYRVSVPAVYSPDIFERFFRKISTT